MMILAEQIEKELYDELRQVRQMEDLRRAQEDMVDVAYWAGQTAGLEKAIAIVKEASR